MGSAQGFSIDDRIDLPTIGATACLLEDLDDDGDLDIAFSNHYTGSSYKNDSYVYRNESGSFSVDSRSELPTLGAHQLAAADLNDDGFMELVFSNYSNDSSYDMGSYLYWGSEEGYSEDDRTVLASSGPVGPAKIIDLNDDGYLDIILAGYYDGDDNVNTYIHYGSSSGYDEADTVALSGYRSMAAEAADFDGDGFIDVVLASYYDGDYVTSSLVFWGSSRGLSNNSRSLLPTAGPRTVLLTDINEDGRPDLFFPSYRDDDYTTDSVLYLGSSIGFQEDNAITLRTYGAWTAKVADMDLDGAQDIIFANYYNGSSYSTDSFVYWNSLRGFSNTNYFPMPCLGARGVVAVGGD